MLPLVLTYYYYYYDVYSCGWFCFYCYIYQHTYRYFDAV